MEYNPPPYNPNAASIYPSIPSAPGVNEMNIQNPSVLNQPNMSPNNQQQNLNYNQQFVGGYANIAQPLQRTHQEGTSYMIHNQLPTNPSHITASTAKPVTKPLRCKSGRVQFGMIGAGDKSAEVDLIQLWKFQYINVGDGVLRISQSRQTRSQNQALNLNNYYASLESKKIVALFGKSIVYAIKTNTEVQAHRWLMVLSEYCFVAPAMEGYCDKFCRGKKKYEERFLRLGSNGVLSWYNSDHEDGESKGAIQLRGEYCVIDATTPTIISVKIGTPGFQFRFDNPREADLWLAAFKWHFGRKRLLRSSLPLRNK